MNNQTLRYLLLGILTLWSGTVASWTATVRVDVTVMDPATGQSLPCRVHWKDSQGTALRAGDQPFWRDHFVCDGTFVLDLAPGRYTYEIERGPEYQLRSGSVQITAGMDKSLAISLERLTHLAAEGWWSGDLHVHRPVEAIELLMRAEDLHVAPVITWWNNRNPWTDRNLPANPLVCFDGNRCYHLMAGEDEREGGALLYFHLRQPLPLAGASREHPSPMHFVERARREPGVWIEIEKPFWWDVPVWLASGRMDSIGLAVNHMCRDRMLESEAWGKPRDAARLPPPLGNGFWTQEIYYHALNCGFRLPPSAGSASGVLPNPVGYNRVYVHLGTAFSWAAWWEGLRAGRVFVSNGPLLRARANGHLPGHVFTAPAGQAVELELTADLTSRDPVTHFEIIKDGVLERRVPLDEWHQHSALRRVRFEQSGWVLLRVLADNPKTFRFASTAPFYVEVGPEKQRVSRASTRFFLDWVRERIARVKESDPARRAEILGPHQTAETFWQEKLGAANAP